MTAGAVAAGNGGPAAKAKRHFVGPDVLRLLAASLVVLYHLSETGGTRPAWPVNPAEAPLGWLAPLTWMGWVGVQMFFVLSGFLISASAVNATASGFLRKRAIRIFPALWLSCLLAFAVRALWGEPVAELLPAALKSAVLSPKGPYIDGVVWTLVVEAAFYALVAFAIAVSHRKAGHDYALVTVAVTIGAASSVFTVAAHMRPDLTVYHSFVFDVLLLRQGMFFAVGMLLFQFLERPPTRLMAIALCVFVAAGIVQIADMIGPDRQALVPVLIWGLSSALMYFSVKYSARLDFGRWQGLCRSMGLMTYPLYLNHFVLSQALMPCMAARVPAIALLPAMFALLLANAWLIAHYPEKSLQRLLGRITLRSERYSFSRLARLPNSFGGR